MTSKRGFAIRGVKDQGVFSQTPTSTVLRQIMGDEADDEPLQADESNSAEVATTGPAEVDEAKRLADEVRTAAAKRQADDARAAEAKRLADDARTAAAKRQADNARTAEAKRKTDAEAVQKGQDDKAELTPQQLAELRRSGSRQAVYTRKKDQRGMVKVGFSATRAFDLRLQEFTSLLVDDTRNEWLMRTLDDAMNDQREQLIARRKKLHDLAERGGSAQKHE